MSQMGLRKVKPQCVEEIEQFVDLNMGESDKIQILRQEHLFWRKEAVGWIVYNKKKKHYLYYPYEEIDMEKYEKVVNGEVVPIDRDLSFNLVAPLRAYFDITYDCNFNCSYCYNKEYIEKATKKKYLSIDAKLRLLHHLYNSGVYRLSLAGGEPFLAKDFCEVVRNAVQIGMDVSVSTNGSYLNDEILQLIKDGYLKRVSISLDSMSEVGNGKRKGLHINKVVKNIKKLKNETNVDMAIKFVIDIDKDLEDLRQVASFCDENQIRTIKLSFMRKVYDDHKFDNDETLAYYKMHEEIQKLNKVYNVNFIPSCTPVSNNNLGILHKATGMGCAAGKDLVYINPYGDIKPCIMFPNESVIGNIERDRLVDLWDHANKKPGNQSVPIKCTKCDISSICLGGCRSRAQESGDKDGSDPYCYQRVRKNLKKNESLLEENLRRAKNQYNVYLCHF